MKARPVHYVFSVLLTLLLLEGAARAWVAFRWSPEWTYLYTHHTPDRGAYTSDSELGYTLRPNFRSLDGSRSHNTLGYRGRQFTAEKPPEAFRVVLAGASTIYGIYAKDTETSAARLEGELSALLPGRRVEVVNAGVPGWTSIETLRSLPGRILRLHPDILLIADGRNDIFPQLFNNFRDDYTHYRLPKHTFVNSNYYHKIAFQWSHLFMLFATGRTGRLGFSERDENPAYAVIDYSNRPSAEDVLQNAQEARRTDVFRDRLLAIAGQAQAAGVQVVLSTVPFLPEKYASGVLPAPGRKLRTAIASLANRNNDMTREVARKLGIPLVDPARELTRKELLRDDCHFGVEGEKLYASLMRKAMRPLILLDAEPSSGFLRMKPRKAGATRSSL